MEYIPNMSEPSEIINAVNDGEEIQVKDKNSKIDKSKPPKPVKQEQSEDNEIIPDYNGTFLPVGGVNEMIHPEMFAQGVFRRGDLEILNEEEYLNRKVTPMKINFKQSKLGDSQTFWIDNKTGIVLKTVIYDNEKPVRSIYFESIDFPNKINSAKFRLFTTD